MIGRVQFALLCFIWRPDSAEGVGLLMGLLLRNHDLTHSPTLCTITMHQLYSDLRLRLIKSTSWSYGIAFLMMHSSGALAEGLGGELA